MTEGALPAAPVLSVVIPVYNEGEAVEPVLRALSAALTSHGFQRANVLRIAAR